MDLIVSRAESLERDRLPLAGGVLSLFTARDPEKTSDNEDVVAVIDTGPSSGVIVLADGAGGLPAGARASRLAAEQVARSLVGAEESESLRSAILDGIEAANRAILGTRCGSATTLEVVEIQGGTMRSYHVGDSATLLVGGRGKVKYRTVSHSPVGYALESGLMDPAEALLHEDLNIVSNLVGTQEMRIDVGPIIDLSPRDTLLVTSDGLTDNLEEEEIVDAIRKGPLDRARQALSRLVARRMSSADGPSKPDDATFLLFRLG